jgi:hypothetical protein
LEFRLEIKFLKTPSERKTVLAIALKIEIPPAASTTPAPIATPDAEPPANPKAILAAPMKARPRTSSTIV